MRVDLDSGLGFRAMRVEAVILVPVKNATWQHRHRQVTFVVHGQARLK